ncbi:uncharacterized protein LOC100176132 [Ciona intestinalis]
MQINIMCTTTKTSFLNLIFIVIFLSHVCTAIPVSKETNATQPDIQSDDKESSFIYHYHDDEPVFNLDVPSHEEDLVDKSYFSTASFYRKVSQVVENSTAADLKCAIKHGRYFIQDLQGGTSCVHCNEYCEDPVDGMKKLCKNHCNDFMERMITNKRMLELHYEIKELRSELQTSNTTAIISLVVSILTVISCAGIMFHMRYHLHQNYQHRYPRSRNTKGNQVTHDTAGEENAQYVPAFQATDHNDVAGSGFLPWYRRWYNCAGTN